MWAIDLYTELHIEWFGLYCNIIYRRNPGMDPSDYFWTLVADTTRYRDRIEIFREIIKRKIPFRLQYNISYRKATPHGRIGVHYREYIHYTIVVDDPKYALICKLIWGGIRRKKQKVNIAVSGPGHHQIYFITTNGKLTNEG